MPITFPANTQHVLQMSSVVEKVQVQQALHLALDQLAEEEQARQNEAKRLEVQDPENSNPTDPANPDERGNRRRRVRIKKRKEPADTKEPASSSTAAPSAGMAEKTQGVHLDVVA
ncbi:hypothetical protein NITGR_730040 [Nitrospina gracilis 3/211]|uniref:Uncharacterized protein n=1 Tax=Nitrospina gracilis (strain 3/211) TaxID=1266370 RepID=M1Z1H7_NITG3|nr:MULTISPECIES: hypothetical protein [Nitrospina]MCF8724425.1 hypothetical protein [Nitrospina sp. Nb-3]CCQ91582.1 hypothetical protein NITGR_730040 [Nitrospina gracilis 3/211]